MNKALTVGFLIIVIFSSIALTGNAYAANSFHGVITASDTWTKAASPYTLDGPTAIASGVTITIEPGVTVNLNSHYLQVNGTLIAKGTESEKIYFTNGQVIYTTASPGGTAFEYTVTDSLQTATTLRIAKNTFNSLDAGGASSVTDNTIASLTAQDSATVTVNTVTSSCYVQGSAKVSSNNINCRLIFKGGGEVSNNKISDGIHCDIGGGNVIITNNQITNTNGYPLIFIAGAKAVISNNKIVGQNSPESGIRIGGSYHSGIQTEATITGNQISGCKTGIEVSNAWATIKQNAIYNNNLGMSIAIMSSFNIPAPGTNTVDVQQNTIAKNSIGMQYQPDGLTASITNNNIQDNSNYNFKLDSPVDLTIGNNFWGTTSTEQISQKIYDQQYDFNLGKVNTNPALTSPVAQAPAIPIDIQTPSSTPIPTQTTQPTINPTTNPTYTSTSTPTVAPSQAGNQSPFELNPVEVAILAVLVIIALLLAVLIVTLQHRRR